MNELIILPSILSANFFDLKTEFSRLKKAGIKWIHYDVMDGHFVKNISFGPGILKSLKEHTSFKFDVHLMIEDPEFYFKDFIEAGADIITVHYETINLKIFNSLLKLAKENNIKLGLSIKPSTKVESLLPYLKDIDLLLVMSVEPGFGGQSFIKNTYQRIKYFYNLKKELQYNYVIEVDGGINDKNSKEVIDCGASMLVMGSYIFKSKDYLEAINKVKEQ